MLNYIQGDCGSSKTHKILEMMKRSDYQYLLVHSEIQLMKQSANALGDICTLISSEEKV